MRTTPAQPRWKILLPETDGRFGHRVVKFRRTRLTDWLMAIRAATLALAVAALAGCTSVIVPPADPAEPVRVLVLDHGRHSSLVLPAPDGGAVRYSYGDWDYYVLEQTDLASGLHALVRPSAAALGRQALPGPVQADAIRSQLRVQVVEALEVVVAAEATRRLYGELEALFAEGRARALHHNATIDVYFVPHPLDYTLAHNSNLVVGQWLEALGCTVRGRPLLSNWRVAPR